MPWRRVLTGLVFSIAVPIGSYHPALRWTLESLKAQDGGVRIAAMDASGDERVAAMLDEYTGMLTHRRSGPDAGQAAAIQEGWDALGGDVLGWLNADDFLYPGALAAARRAFESPDPVDVVTGDTVLLDGAGQFYGFHPGVGPPDERLLRSNPISQPSTFARRDAVEAIGGLNHSLHFTMDWDLWVRLFTSGARFVSEPSCLSGVRIATGTKTMGFGRARRSEILRVIGPHTSRIRRAKVLTGIGLQYIDDQTGLVSRAIDLFGSRRVESQGAPGPAKIIAHRYIPACGEIPIVHFNSSATRSVRVDCDGPLAVLISGGGMSAEATSGPDGRTELDFALQPGAPALLTFSVPPGGFARLTGIEFGF